MRVRDHVIFLSCLELSDIVSIDSWHHSLQIDNESLEGIVGAGCGDRVAKGSNCNDGDLVESRMR